VLKIYNDKNNKFWQRHCTDSNCSRVYVYVNKMLKLKTVERYSGRLRKNQRASAKSKYTKNLEKCKEDCREFNTNRFHFARSLKSVKYNTNIIGEDNEVVLNGGSIWEYELDKTLRSAEELIKICKKYKIKDSELKDKRKEAEILYYKTLETKNKKEEEKSSIKDTEQREQDIQKFNTLAK